MPRSRAIVLEVSAGELVDRLTILRLKRARLPVAQRPNVERALRAVEGASRALPPGWELALPALQAVNERLWEVEEALRACEARGAFGPRFVELARSVYRLNDERAAIKRRIDLDSSSSIVEEKSHSIATWVAR